MCLMYMMMLQSNKLLEAWKSSEMGLFILQTALMLWFMFIGLFNIISLTDVFLIILWFSLILWLIHILKKNLQEGWGLSCSKARGGCVGGWPEAARLGGGMGGVSRLSVLSRSRSEMDKLFRSFSREALLFCRSWSGRITGWIVEPTIRSRWVFP